MSCGPTKVILGPRTVVLAVRPIYAGRIRPKEVANGGDVPIARRSADGGDVTVGISAARGQAWPGEVEMFPWMPSDG